MTWPSSRRIENNCSCLASMTAGACLLQRQIALSVRLTVLGFRFRNYTGGGYPVAFLHFHQSNALRRAPGLPDLGGFETNDLAVLGDNHQVALLLDGENRNHRSDARRGLHVDDALAAARREPVILQWRALAVAVLGDGQDEPGL